MQLWWQGKPQSQSPQRPAKPAAQVQQRSPGFAAPTSQPHSPAQGEAAALVPQSSLGQTTAAAAVPDPVVFSAPALQQKSTNSHESGKTPASALDALHRLARLNPALRKVRAVVPGHVCCLRCQLCSSLCQMLQVRHVIL